MKKCTCIIIDDEEDIIKVFSEILTGEGINVLAKGNNGKEAVELYQKYKPKFVLLDMKMPEFDGKYAIKRIKEYDPDAKIIIITAIRDLEPDLQDVFAVIEKPGDIEATLDLIKNLC